MAQLAVQRTVVQVYLGGGSQTYATEVFFAIADNPCLPTGKNVFKFRPYGLVESLHVRSADTLTIRRIGDDNAFGCRCFFPCGYGLYGQIHILGHTGGSEVAAGYINGCRRDVTADDGMCDGAFFTIVIGQTIKEVGIKIGPMFKGKALTEHTRLDIGGNQSGFHKEGAAAAHGVDERPVAAVSAQQQYTGGEDLANRRLSACATPATLVQALTGRVQ